MQIKSYRDLIVWQRSLELASVIYKLTNQFPKEELYGLVSQMRRCSISIPSNIAEGRSRSTRKDFSNFLRIALGSSAELLTQLEISYKLNFLDETTFKKMYVEIEEIQKMLSSIIRKLAPNS